MPNPLVSVIMPVYNREEMVSKAMDSILQQSYTNLEFIIVNDGSTDNTAKILHDYAAKDKRIQLHDFKQNLGLGLARAFGNKMAKGQYIAIMDSDDIALEDRLQKQVDYMESNPSITLLGACAMRFQPGFDPVRMKMPMTDDLIKARLIYIDRCFVHPTVMIRKQFLDDNNVNYSSDRRTDDDYDFYIKLMLKGAKFANTDDVMLDYIRGEHNSTFTSKAHLYKDKLPLRETVLRHYYPDLSHQDVKSLARILEIPFELHITEAFAGLTVLRKAFHYTNSITGENKQECQRILQEFEKALVNFLNQQLS